MTEQSQSLPPIIATSFSNIREEQIKTIAERLNRFLKLNIPSPLFFEDLTQLLTLILEPKSNNKTKEGTMNNLLTIQDIQIVAGRIRRMLKNDWIENEVLTRDVTTIVDALESVDEIIFKEAGE